MLEMIKKILYQLYVIILKDLTESALAKKTYPSDIDISLETNLVSKNSSLSSCLAKKTADLEKFF